MRSSNKAPLVLASLATILLVAGCSDARKESGPVLPGPGTPLATVFAIGTPSGMPAPTLDESQRVFVDLRSGKAVGTITPHGARLEGTPVFPPGYETPPPKPQRD